MTSSKPPLVLAPTAEAVTRDVGSFAEMGRVKKRIAHLRAISLKERDCNWSQAQKTRRANYLRAQTVVAPNDVSSPPRHNKRVRSPPEIYDDAEPPKKRSRYLIAQIATTPPSPSLPAPNQSP